VVLVSNYSPQAGYCEADYLNHFVVDPDLNLHKCTVAFDEEHRIGYIDQDGKAIMDAGMYAKWMLREGIEKNACRDCKILPLCSGGCGFSTLCSKGKAVCSTINDPQMTIENLRMLYRNQMIERDRTARRQTEAPLTVPVQQS
jgi:uncharacterized protein